jgi:sugar transferase (PEP-CTERM/EpsH1 system associated)
MPVRIMHVVEAFGVGGGVENGIANLVNFMDPDQFEHVLCGVFKVGPQMERYSPRVKVLCLNQPRKPFSTQVPALRRAIRELKPDVVHSRNWGALESVAAGRFSRGCAVIHSEHGFEVDPSAEPARRSAIRRIAFELADRVFAVSDHLRQNLCSRTGYALQKMGVIHNGVDMSRFRPDPAARQRFRSKLGIPADVFCMGCVGRLSKIKDYPTILNACDSMSPSADWRLLIAGTGAEETTLKRFAADRPALRDRVIWVGATSRVPEVLSALDVYVLPSITEGISNSLLEAMATHVPVVVTQTGGNTEVVVDGESGLLFPVGAVEELSRLLTELRDNPAVRSRLALGALEGVKREFSLDAMVRQYEELYRSLATKSGVAGARQLQASNGRI